MYVIYAWQPMPMNTQVPSAYVYINGYFLANGTARVAEEHWINGSTFLRPKSPWHPLM